MFQNFILLSKKVVLEKENIIISKLMKEEKDEIDFSIKPYVLKNEKKTMDKFSSDLKNLKVKLKHNLVD